MNEGHLDLSVVLVVGPLRVRSQRVLDALCAQTVLDRIEIVVVDFAVGDGVRPLRSCAGARIVYVEMPADTLFTETRAEGARRASAPVVAFLEDHCFPQPGWAAAVIDAHKGEFSVIGYAFTNANPRTYVSRASLVKDYGPWLHPASAEERIEMPGNNVSYRRDHLQAFGDNLTYLLTPDYSLQRALQAAGHKMRLEPSALVAHQNYEKLAPAARSNAAYARMLGARRASSLGWGPSRRLVYGILTPLGAPAVSLLRLVWSLRERPSLARSVLVSMPVYLTVAFTAAAGEAMGYIFGEGDAQRQMTYWEHSFPRTAD